jgi:hypothetical protein
MVAFADIVTAGVDAGTGGGAPAGMDNVVRATTETIPTIMVFSLGR